MTITELLDKLGAAFPAFNARALEAWASVFRARLGRHEGAALAQAYADTLGAFSVAKSKSLFPVPADFEPHLPTARLQMGGESPTLDLKSHHVRKEALITNWWRTQGSRIEEARGSMVAGACRWEVGALAHDSAWKPVSGAIILTAAQIDLCEARVVSSERLAAFGPYALRRHEPEEWQTQMTQTRILVRANRRAPRKKATA